MRYQYDDPLRAATPLGRARYRRRRAAIAGVCFVIGLLATLAFTREERLEPLTRATWEAAVRRWRASGIRDYDLRVRLQATEYDVEVRDDIVVSVRVNGREAPSRTWPSYSVRGLLGTLETELESLGGGVSVVVPASPAVMARARFHPELGYPEKYLRSGGPERKPAVMEVLDFRRRSSSD